MLPSPMIPSVFPVTSIPALNSFFGHSFLRIVMLLIGRKRPSDIRWAIVSSATEIEEAFGVLRTSMSFVFA